jgi:hypothetical protein
MSRSIFIVVVSFTLLLTACKKTDNFSLGPVSDYYPLTVGKYITYNMDSITFPNYGESQDTFQYQIQYVVDAQITDNLNRTAYRIIRNIRPDSSYGWTPDNTSMAVNTGSTIEFTEDNEKYIKLVEPIQEGYSWKGNSYLYTNNDYSYLANWNYTYDSLNATITLGNLTVDSTVKVNEEDYSLNYPVTPNDSQLVIRTYSMEKYAKGIGLVYRNFFYQNYQPPEPDGSGGNTPAFSQGYGIILTMIDHN